MSTRNLFFAGPVFLSFGSLAFGQALTPLERLGKALFFDNISQPAASMSCASCHAPSAGWTGAIPGINLHGAVYRGAVPTRFGNRKPPTSAYATFAPPLEMAGGEFVGGVFWDGRATGWRLGSPAAEQALGPFLNPVEQNMPNPKAVCEHVAKSKYAALFTEVWGAGSLDCGAGVAAMYDRIGLSIAAYEGSAESSPFSSKFDAYWKVCRTTNSAQDCGLAGKAKQTLDPNGILTIQEFDGLKEFGEYCSACHISHVDGPGNRPPLFTDFRFDNVGVPRNPENPFYHMDKQYLDNGDPINPAGAAWIDPGLGGFLETTIYAQYANANFGKFRTPNGSQRRFAAWKRLPQSLYAQRRAQEPGGSRALLQHARCGIGALASAGNEQEPERRTVQWQTHREAGTDPPGGGLDRCFPQDPERRLETSEVVFLLQLPKGGADGRSPLPFHFQR